jgi:hypothetical protein
MLCLDRGGAACKDGASTTLALFNSFPNFVGTNVDPPPRDLWDDWDVVDGGEEWACDLAFPWYVHARDCVGRVAAANSFPIPTDVPPRRWGGRGVRRVVAICDSVRRLSNSRTRTTDDRRRHRRCPPSLIWTMDDAGRSIF